MIRCYADLIKLHSFEERFEYLKLTQKVGDDVFAENRFLNQEFYHSQQWRSVRDRVIIRDNGLDLGCPGYELGPRVMIHHMNPIVLEDLMDGNEDVLDPEFLITTSRETHLAIHYGDPNLLPKLSTIRKPGDTRLW
ncbi:hypothetical protein E2P63_05315 [Candidatus Bathyarchaeota archaeon]|nr:hypothetical protein E2P63_05315 [Candidatus Bathyarchaeota archaeon]